MKTIGVLGGMSWESTLPYYRILNRIVAERLGGLHSAKVLLYSFDFQEIESLQSAGRWDAAGDLLAGVAARLEAAGAELLVLATNTMHEVAPRIEGAVGIPLLHVADAVAEAVRDAGIGTVGLLGTRFTMERTFYRDRLAARGLATVVPEPGDRDLVHRVIYEELCRGDLREGSRGALREVVGRLAARGAEGVVLGCTELGLLLRPADVDVPVFDSTEIHARAAALAALAVGE